jgi:gamma-tubulin complex component 5
LPWAIQNIVQRSALPIYQQTFTFLLQTYRAKYLLQAILLQNIRGLKDPKLQQLSFKLRTRLIWFADVLRSYLTETVIALSTEDMITAMSKAGDIDEMSNIHIKYLARLQEQSLLADNLKPIHGAIISLLDLAVLFHDAHMKEAQSQVAATAEDSSFLKGPTGKKSKSSRRKSVIPAIVENESSDSDSEDEKDEEVRPSSPETVRRTTFSGNLRKIDNEFTRLLPFITAGLRNIGRVGAEPVWEMLAERLEWDKKKDRF